MKSNDCEWWGKSVQTIFYQGITSSQTQLTKYTPASIRSTTGQLMMCKKYKQELRPLDVLIRPFIGKEIGEVNLPAFKNTRNYFNPVKLTSALIARYSNWHNEIYFDKSTMDMKSDLKTHTLSISKMSMGQETDILSHLEKYQLWKKSENSDLVLWGVSKGAATTFNAFAKYQYPEVKLVVLEGCFADLQDVLDSWFPPKLANFANQSLSLFTQYKKDGASPIKNVDKFPPHVPVVFVTSKTDTIVPATSTKRLAKELAKRGQNDVYYLELIDSKHADYMFTNQIDHDCYEALIHAIYKKYGLPHIIALAERGKHLLEECQLSAVPPSNYLRGP